MAAFLICLGGAGYWGLANVGMRRMNQVTEQPVDAFGFMVWMSLVPPVPLFVLSLIFEGPGALPDSARHLSVAEASRRSRSSPTSPRCSASARGGG